MIARAKPLSALARFAAECGAPHRFVQFGGHVAGATPAALEVEGLAQGVELGARVCLGEEPFGEIVRIDRGRALVAPYRLHARVPIGAALMTGEGDIIRPGMDWLGRALDAFGLPIDGGPPPQAGFTPVRLDASAPPALERPPLGEKLETGVRVIDIFTPLCFGQRIGVFAGSGVGKSTLLAMLARADSFDAVVVGLIGERGREVREMLEGPLAAARQKTVTIVATGDESALLRRRAAFMALSAAEWLRDQGMRVLLIMDSITRFAHALREIDIAAGAPAVARGYPPSVFSELPRLLERIGAGVSGAGSITGVISVLVDGDDHNDPIADTVRGVLDGHIVLERAIADQGRYPAVDILKSLSRLSNKVWSRDQTAFVRMLRAHAARFEDTRDLRAINGFKPGADAELDAAVALTPRLYAALAQSPEDGPQNDAFAFMAATLGFPTPK
ncbi:MAG: FliI/YscN family ATPase [Hyphomicrobiales bacterium]|nr:FliI/YscN family ATPase [Hyphomicrobiales bacterium]